MGSSLLSKVVTRRMPCLGASFSEVLARGLLTLVAVAAFVLVPAPNRADARTANGGSTIAGAPFLPVGQTVTGGSGPEFWTVSLSSGDTLTLDFKSVNGGCASVYVYPPGTTDATVNSTSYVTSSGACSSAQEIKWTATAKGAWVLKVSSDNGYQLTGHVAAAQMAQASASSTIAQAGELPRGRAFVDGAGFWRVTLSGGDRLTVDFKSVNGGCASVYVYPPGTTDATVNSTSYVTSAGACSSGQELTWVATAKGAWVLKVTSDNGYQLTGRVAAARMAQASASPKIAGARELPRNRAFVDGAGFWRVTLRAGDKLLIDFKPVNGGCTSLYVYPPRVTDYTVNNTSYVTSSGACSNGNELAWVAPSVGRWILKVTSDNGYQLVAHVRTRASTARPQRVRCRLASRTGRVGQKITGSCSVPAATPRGTRIAIVYRVAGGFATATSGHVGGGGMWRFFLKANAPATFDLWVEVAATSRTKAVRISIGRLIIH